MSKRRYEVRIPRNATGIRAQESRTGSGRSWWSRRYLEVLEGMGLGARLGRGRNYAFSGQIVELALDGSHAEAKVVGTRVEPYVVTLDFRRPEGEARRRILDRLRAEPIIAARLLADDLPLEVEAAFREEGYDFFPGGKLAPGKYDMTTRCTCPDYANPCKHTAAVLFLLGEELSRRPATMLELRGFTLDEILI